MKENFYFKAMQGYIASGLSVREAHEHFLRDYNSYPHPTAKQLFNIINKASRDDSLDPASRPAGLNVKLITDPAEVERRKLLTDKVWQIFYAGYERQTPQNKNTPQIDRALQRFRNNAIPGREEELARVFGLTSKSTDDEKKQLYTELMLEFLDFDWNEVIRPKTDSEFVEFYSNPDNYSRLQIILEIEKHIDKCKQYQLDNAITESVLEVKNKLMGKCTLDLNRLEMISTNVYKNCDPVELYRDPKGLELFRFADTIAPLMKVKESEIACPASWKTSHPVFAPEVASIIDYCSFGMDSLLEDKLNRLIYSLRGDSLIGSAFSGAFVKLPDKEAYRSDEQLYKDCIDGTSFFIPNAEDPDYSAIVTISRGGNVRWGYCSKQSFDLMANSPKDTLMEWVDGMTPFDETVIPGNEDMYVRKHGLSQETRAEIIKRNELEKELTQLALSKNSSLREKLAVRDKTVAEITKAINSHRDGIAETIKNRNELSVFKFRSDLSEHLATAYVNALVLQQINSKGDTIKVDEINELYNKDFIADTVDTIRQSPGFKHFVETVEIKDLEALTDKSTGSYSNKALADMKSKIEGEISSYVEPVVVPPQNDREKILRWYNSLEETLRLQGVDINDPADRMRVITSDISYSPATPGSSRDAVNTDYYAFMDRKVNEDGSLGDYVTPKPFPSKDEQQKIFDPLFDSYLTATQELDIAYTNYNKAKKAHGSEAEIDRLLSRVEECNSKYHDVRNAYNEYWDKLIAPTNKWLLTGTRKFDPNDPGDFKLIENLYNNSKDGYLRLQTLGRNSRSMIQIGVGKDGLAKTGVNLLEVPDKDADPYGELAFKISQSGNGNPDLAEYAKLPPLKKVPNGLENDRDAITVIAEANKIIEAQYDDFLKNRLDKYYPDVENSAKMINALSVISQNNFIVPPADGTYGSWSEMFYAEFAKHYNIFTNEMHDSPESYDSNGMRKPEISNKFRDEHILTEGEKMLDTLVEQALYTKMVNTAVRPYRSLELEEMRSKTEAFKTESERRQQARLDAEKQAFFSDKAWSMLSTNELMKKIGNLYEKNTDFGSKIFTAACMKNRMYDRNGEVNENALSDEDALNGINRLISLATGSGNISEEDKAFLSDLEARAQGPAELPQAFDSMVSMLASTMDFKHDYKDITSPAQAYIANVYFDLHNRYPETNINGILVSENGQDRSVSHPDDREAYLVLGSQVSGIQKAYGEFRSELDSRKSDGPADLSIKRDRDLLLEGQAAPDMPSAKDYMTFVRKEIKENAYFTPNFDTVSKFFESYEYDKFKAKMNFEKWVKKEKGNLLKQKNKGVGSYLAHKAKLAAKQCIITEVLRNIVGKDKDVSKAVDYFAQPTDEGFQKSLANLGTFCETLKNNPDRVDQLLNLNFESYRVINPENHVNMQIEFLGRDNCRAESYMRDLFDVHPGDGSGMFKPENAERAREYEQWHQSAMALKMEVPEKYKDIANFIIMGSFFSREVMNDEWIREYGEAGGSSGFLCTYDSALSNFFECTITGDNRANMQIIRKNEMPARLMANRIMASNDPDQVKGALKTAARTLFENVRLQGKTLKDEYRVAHKYLNELIQKAGEIGLHDEDLGITPEMREKINLYDNIAKVNRARIDSVNKVQRLYRDNFFTGVDISDNPELKEAAARAHGCNNLMIDLITEFKSKKLVYENEMYFIHRFKQNSYDEESRVEIENRAHNTPLSAMEKAFNENPNGFIEKYVKAAKTEIDKDFTSPKLEDRLNKVLKARDPAIVTSMDTCSPREFLKSMEMFERNAHFFDASNPEIAREMRSISAEANRCLTEDGAYNELNIDQLMQRISLLGNVSKIKGSPKNEVDFFKEQLNNVAEGYKSFKKLADAYKVNLSNIEKITGVPAGTYASQLPAPSQITERGVFRIGESVPKDYNLNTMYNELKQVSLVRGSKEFKDLSDGIKELITFTRRNGNFLNDASKCEEFKELLSLVSNAAGVYADKKSKDPDILNAETNTSKRFHFAQRVLRATNVMEKGLTKSMMRNLEHNAAKNAVQNAERRTGEAHIGPASMH